jgi:hypothetical protein
LRGARSAGDEEISRTTVPLQERLRVAGYAVSSQ